MTSRSTRGSACGDEPERRRRAGTAAARPLAVPSNEHADRRSVRLARISRTYLQLVTRTRTLGYSLGGIGPWNERAVLAWFAIVISSCRFAPSTPMVYSSPWSWRQLISGVTQAFAALSEKTTSDSTG